MKKIMTALTVAMALAASPMVFAKTDQALLKEAAKNPVTVDRKSTRLNSSHL